MRILIVDDSKAMRMIMKRTLRQAGFGGHAVEEASNGREALDAIRQSAPDVVICDWNMPEMSGIELLEQLSSAGIRTQFGFATSEGTDDVRERARALGAQFFITKPFTPDKFEHALASILGA